MSFEFEAAYKQFIEKHTSQLKREPLRRLQEGHGYGEKLFLERVWWPAYKNFDCLHPEYIVIDMRYGSYFLDFAFIPHPPLLQLAIEIDGFGSHAHQLDRRQFTDQLNRQNFLVAMDWKVLRFSVDEIKENASRCIQYLQLLLGRYYGVNQPTEKVTLLEREVLRLCIKLGRPIHVKEVTHYLNLHSNTTQSLLRKMAAKCLLLPTKADAIRVRTYKLNEAKLNHLLL
jgi:very-short-patch-repair endonuclease